MAATIPIPTERVWPITREQFEQMIELGWFHEDDRVELLEGVIVRMSPQGDAHLRIIVALRRALARALGDRVEVVQQLPFPATEKSRPEPDVSLWPNVDVAQLPPAQPYLVVEVSVSTLRDDRRIKSPTYALAGVPEYWIVNVDDDLVEVYTEPTPQGYLTCRKVSRGQRITLVAFPDVDIAVDDFLP